MTKVIKYISLVRNLLILPGIFCLVVLTPDLISGKMFRMSDSFRALVHGSLQIDSIYLAGSTSTSNYFGSGLISTGNNERRAISMTEVHQHLYPETEFDLFLRRYRSSLPQEELIWTNEAGKIWPRKLGENNAAHWASIYWKRILLFSIPLLLLLLSSLGVYLLKRRQGLLLLLVILSIGVANAQENNNTGLRRTPLIVKLVEVPESAALRVYESTQIAVHSPEEKEFDLSSPLLAMQSWLHCTSNECLGNATDSAYYSPAIEKSENHFRSLNRLSEEDLVFDILYQIRTTHQGREIALIRFNLLSSREDKTPPGLYVFVRQGEAWRYAPGLLQGESLYAFLLVKTEALMAIISNDPSPIARYFRNEIFENESLSFFRLKQVVFGLFNDPDPDARQIQFLIQNPDW